MQLEAITICIYYADYLQYCIDNRSHFDTWHIVTVPSDVETQALCSTNELICHVVDFYGAKGELFNATNNKAVAINYALDRLAPESWALIIDADIILPRKFRKRLDSIQLSKARLYGVQGRRIVSSPNALPQLLHREIQHGELESQGFILGYFQLFSNASPHSRYIPVSHGAAIGQHDDLRFADQYPSALRSLLPFTVLHLGEAYRNWSERCTPRFMQKPLDQESPVPTAPPMAAEADVIVDYGAPAFQLPAKAILLDISPVAFHENPTPFREQLMALLNQECVSVYIACDITSALLSSLVDLFAMLNICPAWIGGSGFANDSEHFRTVAAVLMHLGPPEEVWSTGMWRKVAPGKLASNGSSRVILYVPEEERLQEAFLCAALIALFGGNCVVTGRGTNTVYAEWLAHLSKAKVATAACDAYSNDVPKWADWLAVNDGNTALNLHLDYCEWFPTMLPLCVAGEFGYEWKTESGEMVARTSTAIALGKQVNTITLAGSQQRVARADWARAGRMLRVPVYLPQGTLLQFRGSCLAVLALLRSIRFEGGRILAATVSRRLLQILERVELIPIVYNGEEKDTWSCVAEIVPAWRATRPVWLHCTDQRLPLTVRCKESGTGLLVLRAKGVELPTRPINSDEEGKSVCAELLGLVGLAKCET